MPSEAHLTDAPSRPRPLPHAAILTPDAARRFLVEASEALASSLDYETTLRTVARLMVPTLADWCAVDLATAEGGLRRLAVTHVDPAREAQAWEIGRRYPPDPGSGSGTLAVLRSGEPQLYESITDDMLTAGARDAEHLALLRALELRSYIGAPLTANGRTVGVLSLATGGDSARHYGPADLELVMEVASRAAVAVHHATEHRTERIARAAAEVAAERATQLLDVSLALGAAITEESVGAVALDAIVGAVKPKGAALMLIDSAGEALEVVQARGFATSLIDRYRRIPLTADVPPCHAVGTRRAVILETRQARMAAYPALNPELEQTQSGAIVALPLIAHDRPSGAIALSFSEERPFTDGDRAFMLTLASQCAQAFERARLFDAERRSRAEAERSLLALREGELRFRSIFESRMLGIAFWNGSSVTDANPAFLELLGYTEADVATGGLRAERLSPPEYAEADARALNESLAKGTCEPYEKELFRKDGSRVPVLVGGTILGDGTGVFFVLDMTRHREALEQLQTAQRMEAVGRLAGGVAHEINNALQGVLGFSRFALQALPAGDRIRSDVEQVERSAHRAASITQQLLAYSRRQLLRPAAHDLDAIVGAFEPMLRQALGPERDLEIRRRGRPAMIMADRGQIEQVLLNLTLNARDAMRQGGHLLLEIGCEEAPAASRPARLITLTVTDDGHGMDGRTLAQIFDPFFTTKPPGEGTGLGLAVVQGIVRQSGGQIVARSEPGRGATFRILLPEAGRMESAEPAAGEPMASGGSETVLLVDDEEAVRAVVGRLLRELGYSVLEAATPSAALAELEGAQARGETVSLIVSDIVMPAGGGEAIGRDVEAWRKRRGIGSIPILYISGHNDEHIAHRTLEGRAAFIQKPFEADLLARTVRALLDSASSAP